MNICLRWYGKRKRPHYGEIIARGRQADPEAVLDLISLSKDTLFPGIVRATALSLLSSYPSQLSHKAIENYEQSIRIDDLFLPAKNNLAMLYNAQGKNEKAAEKALSVEPDNFDFLFALADHYIKKNRLDSARKVAGKMIQLFPDNKIRYDILRYINSR